MRRLILCFILIACLASSAFAQQWSKYVPDKPRREIVKKSSRATGIRVATLGYSIGIAWITEPMARAVVSEMIDRERLTPEEADARYLKLRPEKSFLFMMFTHQTATRSPLGVTSARSLGDPITASETFLQRSDDQKRFSKAEIIEHDSDLVFAGLAPTVGAQNTYKIVFPRADRSGELLVKDLADKMEIQFTLSGRKIVLDYKLKEMIASLQEL